MIFALILGVVLTLLCFFFTDQLVGVFLIELSAYEYTVTFVKILLTTSALFGPFYVLTNALQAMGAATASLIINLSRQGLIYIPMLFLLRALLQVTGLIWAQPVAVVLSTALAAIPYFREMKKRPIWDNIFPAECAIHILMEKHGSLGSKTSGAFFLPGGDRNALQEGLRAGSLLVQLPS